MKRHHAAFAALLSLNLTAAYAADPHAHHADAPSHDDRVVLKLTPAERVMILEEMRSFLGGTQKITGALAKQDFKATAEAARSLGLVMAHEVPPALRAKLPQEFRQLGSSVHRDFDQIAMDAESLKDVGHTLHQLSDTLQKCTSCHTMYQIQGPVPTNKH